MIVDQLAIDFIHNRNQVVIRQHLCQLCHFDGGIASAGRIIRVVKDNRLHPCSCLGQLLAQTVRG